MTPSSRTRRRWSRPQDAVALLAWVVASGAAQGADPPPAPPKAAGWLQLQHDQQVYRDRVEPLPPADAATLGHLEQRQRLDLREAQQREAEDRHTQRILTRTREREVPLRPRLPGDPGDVTRQRLEMRLEREALRFPAARQ